MKHETLPGNELEFWGREYCSTSCSMRKSCGRVIPNW